jgi:hypothetical protein
MCPILPHDKIQIRHVPNFLKEKKKLLHIVELIPQHLRLEAQVDLASLG